MTVKCCIWRACLAYTWGPICASPPTESRHPLANELCSTFNVISRSKFLNSLLPFLPSSRPLPSSLLLPYLFPPFLAVSSVAPASQNVRSDARNLLRHFCDIPPVRRIQLALCHPSSFRADPSHSIFLFVISPSFLIPKSSWINQLSFLFCLFAWQIVPRYLTNATWWCCPPIISS